MSTRIIAGRVTQVSNESRMLTCMAEDAAVGEVQAIYMPAILGTMLGLRVACMPLEGTKVLLATDSGSGYTYALGALPDLGGFNPGDFRSALFGGNFSKASTPGEDGERFKYRSGLPPLDLIDGEVDMTNLLDVGVSFLTGMTRLKAGEAAVVETCLLDGLVRIISRNYEHASPLGSFKINTDGNKCTAEFHATSHEHEGLGLEGRADEKVGVDVNQATYPSEADAMRDDIRARLHAYAGWLGDFVSLWVTDAPKQVDGSLKYLAKSRAQFCQDGSVLVQSLADISLERVYRIPVAVRQKRVEDPAGDANFGDTRSDLSREWTPSGADTAFHAAYQMREYARWLANDYSLARFRTLTKDFRIYEPDDTDQPETKYHAGDEKDKAAGQEIAQVYACFRILRTGQIVMIDGDNSSYTMADGNIHMSAARNIRMEAGESVEIIGKDVRVLASRDMELTAGRGFILSAAKWLKGLCAEGGILFKTRAPAADNSTDWQNHNAATANYNGDPPDPADDIPEEHRIEGIAIQSGSKLSLHGQQSLLLTSLGNIRARCNTFFQHAVSVKLVDFNDRVGMVLSSYGGLFVHGSVSILRNLVASFISHTQEYPGGQGPHKNHVGHYETDNFEAEFLENTAAGDPVPDFSQLTLDFAFGEHLPSEMPQSHTQREMDSGDYELAVPFIMGDDGSRPALLNPDANMLTFSRGSPLKDGGRGNANPEAESPNATPLQFKSRKDES